MHKIKKQKGITLVALVITIVVMLILVGVTISVSLKGGLFSTAKQATKETQIAQEKEELLIAALGTLNKNGEVDLSKLDGSLPEGFTGSNGQYTSKTGNVFTVTEDGTITLVGEGSGEQPETPVTPPATATITITPETITGEIEDVITKIEVGTITATVSNVDGDLTWSIAPTDSGLELVDTDNENVKKVTASKAVENATITVSYGEVSDTCTITITEKEEVVVEDELAGLWLFNKTINPIDSGDYILNYNSYMFGELDTFSVNSDEEVFQITLYDSSYPDSWDNIYVYEYYEGGTEKGWRHCLGRLFEITSTLDEMENGEEFLTWLKANAVKTTESEISIITFTIDGAEDYVLEGMTWEEWCSYGYNSYSYATTSECVVDSNGNCIYYNSSPVKPSDEIISGGEYFAQTLWTNPS